MLSIGLGIFRVATIVSRLTFDVLRVALRTFADLLDAIEDGQEVSVSVEGFRSFEAVLRVEPFTHHFEQVVLWRDDGAAAAAGIDGALSLVSELVHDGLHRFEGCDERTLSIGIHQDDVKCVMS